jgi:hypothetical protein
MIHRTFNAHQCLDSIHMVRDQSKLNDLGFRRLPLLGPLIQESDLNPHDTIHDTVLLMPKGPRGHLLSMAGLPARSRIGTNTFREIHLHLSELMQTIDLNNPQSIDLIQKSDQRIAKDHIVRP